MHKEIKNFVSFYMPGIIKNMTRKKEINHSDPNKIKWPDNTFAFELSQRKDVIDGNERYLGKQKKSDLCIYIQIVK